MTASSSSPPLLLIHASGFDWQLAQPLVDSGSMPHLDALIDRGAIGNLMSTVPSTRPSLAGTIATGQRADRHGLLAMNCPDESSPFGLRPVASTDLRAAPLWEIAAHAGLEAAAVGWPASHPATVFDACVVSDAFAEAYGKNFDDWPPCPAAVSRPDLLQTLADLRMHFNDVTVEMALPFVPQAHCIDRETDERLPLLISTLGRAVSIHAAATWIAEHRDWNLLAVHFDLLERLSSAFLQYTAPRMGHVTEVDHTLYSGVVDAAYRCFDMLLGRYIELIDSDCHIIIASDHGYFVGDLRPSPAARNGVKQTYRELGAIVLAGPRVKKDELVFGASIFDVTPTALALLELPVSGDLKGKVLSEAFSNPPEVPSRQGTDGHAFSATSAEDPDWDLARARLHEYATLGYHAWPPADPELACEQAKIVWLHNLAQTLAAANDHAAALEALDELFALDPDNAFALQMAAQSHLALKNHERCREMLSELTAAGVDGPFIKFLHAKLALAEKDHATAAGFLDEAESMNANGVAGQRILERIGFSHISANQLERAETAFRQALEVDPNSTIARNGLGLTLWRLKRPQDAADHFRRSLGNHFEQAFVHHALGNCLAALGRLEEAAEAYRRSLRIKPELKAPRKALTRTENTIAHKAVRKMAERWSP